MAKATSRQAAPAKDPESREQQLVNLAVNLAEQQLMDGSASSAVITHYLKMATKREALERDILQKQSVFLEAKATSISQAKDNENIAKEAMEAFKTYNSSSS